MYCNLIPEIGVKSVGLVIALSTALVILVRTK